MIDKIAKLTKTLPTAFWVTLAGFIGVSTISTPLAIAYLVVHSGGINYTTEDTQIRVLGKKAVNETEYSNKVLQQRLQQLETNIRQLKQSDPQTQAEKIEDVERSFEDLKPTAEKAIENSEDLKDIVTEAIE